MSSRAEPSSQQTLGRSKESDYRAPRVDGIIMHLDDEEGKGGFTRHSIITRLMPRLSLKSLCVAAFFAALFTAKIVVLLMVVLEAAAALNAPIDAGSQTVQRPIPSGGGNQERTRADAGTCRGVSGESENRLWGKDGIKAISKTCDEGSPWGTRATIVDGLDTAIIMNLTGVFAKGMVDTINAESSRTHGLVETN
ncbi:hypothetical protein LZ554_001773 [Drepanopeziza brunnea f. sp. 'monogermtubi']|nr:hypothetical protein LZ554_001773 [Drepanopeziza brunnea f. sp. 'monogermtubi']